MCWHGAKQPAPHNPKTSAGGFATVVPITDRRPAASKAALGNEIPVLCCKMSCSVDPLEGDAAGVAGQATAKFGHILGRRPLTGRQLGSAGEVASDPPAWTCVL